MAVPADRDRPYDTCPRGAVAAPAEPRRPGVSVVIVSWNTRELLLGTLRSFLPLPDGLPAEVIVVDNASADGSPEAVERDFPDVRVLRNDRNLGFAAGVNVGLRAARHELALLLNPDTRVLGDAIGNLAAYARDHPAAAVVGPRVLNEDGSLQSSRFRFPSLLNELLAATYLYQLFPRSSLLNRERLGGRESARPEKVDAVSGCCFLLRQAALDEVGLLDEGYFMYAEETDLCYRAWQAGWQVHYAPVGEIVHLGGGSSRLQRRLNFLQFRRSLLRFFVKHHGRAAAECARVLMLGFLALRIPYWALRSLAPSAGGREASAQLGNYAAGIGYLMQPLPAILGDDPRSHESAAPAPSQRAPSAPVGPGAPPR